MSLYHSDGQPCDPLAPCDRRHTTNIKDCYNLRDGLQSALLSLDQAFGAHQANAGYQHLMTDTLWGAIVNVLNAAKEQELIS